LEEDWENCSIHVLRFCGAFEAVGAGSDGAVDVGVSLDIDEEEVAVELDSVESVADFRPVS
jgi:hypothetical protein